MSSVFTFCWRKVLFDSVHSRNEYVDSLRPSLSHVRGEGYLESWRNYANGIFSLFHACFQYTTAYGGELGSKKWKRLRENGSEKSTLGSSRYKHDPTWSRSPRGHRTCVACRHTGKEYKAIRFLDKHRTTGRSHLFFNTRFMSHYGSVEYWNERYSK